MDIRNEVLATCRALFAPAQVAELRILDIPGKNGFKYNASGWFNDWQALANAAQIYNDRNPSGIYVTINPLHRACLARTDNQVIERSKTSSSDRDVANRTWLPIDFDPVRPSGVSSTIAELAEARDLAGHVHTWLQNECGFGRGLIAHSGNGIHLLYRIDLPNDDASKKLLQAALVVLADRFNNNAVHIDKTMFNAARILKLWGTVTRKGTHQPDRPHRQSMLWTRHTFEEFAVVSHASLVCLAGVERTSADAAADSAAVEINGIRKRIVGSNGKFLVDLDEWLRTHNIAITRTEAFDGSGVRHVLAACLFDSSHTGSSAIIGRAPSGVIFYKCQHDSCASKTWKDVKALYPTPRAPRRRTSAGDAMAELSSNANATPTAGEDSQSGISLNENARAAQRPSVNASDSEEVTPWDLAVRFLDDTYATDDLGRVTIRRHRKTFYTYSAARRVYREMSDDKIRVQITRWLGENGHRTTCRAVNDVQNVVNSLVTVPEELDIPFRTYIAETGFAVADPKHRNWITLANGILDIDAVFEGKPIGECLHNHTTEWFSTIALPFNFPTSKKEMHCMTWIEFLQEVLEDDEERIKVIQEMFGYCFWRNTLLEKFFILYGIGNNGKSTILELLQAMLGEENVSNLTLEQISDPIMAGDLYMKVANICGDLPESEELDEGIIKRIVSGEAVTVRQLYKGTSRFRPYCKLMFGANKLPRFTDNTLGIWRRMMLVPFNYAVPVERIDEQLLSKLKRELPGILIWAIEGALRLAQQHRFSPCAAVDRANRKYRMDCFPVLTFLEECTENEGSIMVRDLWNAYRTWCKDVGLNRPKNLHAFFNDTVGFFPNIRYPRVSVGQAAAIMLKGIRLKTEGITLSPVDENDYDFTE